MSGSFRIVNKLFRAPKKTNEPLRFGTRTAGQRHLIPVLEEVNHGSATCQRCDLGTHQSLLPLQTSTFSVSRTRVASRLGLFSCSRPASPGRNNPRDGMRLWHELLELFGLGRRLESGRDCMKFSWPSFRQPTASIGRGRRWLHAGTGLGKARESWPKPYRSPQIGGQAPPGH